MHYKDVLRPCFVNEKKALFHRWVEIAWTIEPGRAGQTSGQMREVFALVEFEDGTVRRYQPELIKFCDSTINEYIFD